MGQERRGVGRSESSVVDFRSTPDRNQRVGFSFQCPFHNTRHKASLTTGFGANSNQGQIVTSIGYYLGLLVTNLNDTRINLPRPN